MDITQILEIISPYVNVTGIVALVTAVISIAVKIHSCVRKAASELSKTAILDEKKIAELIGKQMPTKLGVAIKPLVESELAKINENVRNATAEFSKKQAAKIDALANAIASMRTLPDAQRQALLDMIEAENKTETRAEVAVEYEVGEEVKALAEAKQTAESAKKTPVFTD